MITILKKEFNEFLNSLIAYVVIGVFLIGVSLVMWVLPDFSVLDYGYATMEPLFTIGPYLFMFLVPATTMKSFAEEKKTGTLELLYTLPFKDWEIILGKYLAAFLLVLFSLIPTLVYYITIHQLGNPVGNLDTPGIIGSYIGLALLAGIFVSLGLLASALTDNQIVSFILAAMLCFLFYDGVEALAGIDLWGTWSYYLQQIGILSHYSVLSKGLLDMQDIGYFLIFISFTLMLIAFTLSSKKS